MVGTGNWARFFPRVTNRRCGMATVRNQPFFKAICVILIPLIVFPQLAGCAAPKPLRPTNIIRDNDMGDYYGSTVAVLAFDNNTEIGQAGDVMQSQFAMSVMRSGKFDLVDRAHLNTLLAERDLAEEGLLDADPQEIGRLLGVKAVIVGSVTDCKPYKYVPAGTVPETVVQQEQTVVVVPDDDDDDDYGANNAAADDDDDNGVGPVGWIIGGLVALAVVLTFAWLWADNEDKEAARIGAYVKMIDVESGRVIWQGEETYSGGDPRVRVLVADDRHKELTEELSAVARLLSDELVDTM